MEREQGRDCARTMGAHQTAGRLAPSMGRIGTLFITVSCLSPSIAVFVVGSDVIRQVGSGVFVCFAMAALFGTAMAGVYGELGSAFPSAGGEYTIYGRVLGRGWAGGVLGLNLLGFCSSLALSAFGVATYLDAVWPWLPARPVAAAIVALVTGIAMLQIRVGAIVTGGFLLVEVAALVVLTGLGVVHAVEPLSVLIHPVVADASYGAGTPTLAALAAGTVAGIYAFNGYGAAIFFGEDMRDGRRDLAPVVLQALAVGVILVMPPIAWVILAAPDLRAPSLAPAPISAFISQLGGHGLAQVMSFGVALAIFNTMIAIALMAGRQLYATGRDGLWPAPISSVLALTHGRLGSPWTATATMGCCGLVCCLLDPHVLVLVLGNSNVVTYAGLCIAALQWRRAGATADAGWRMPWFPAPPVFALVFLLIVAVLSLFTSAGRVGMLVTAMTFGAGLGLRSWAGHGRRCDHDK